MGKSETPPLGIGIVGLGDITRAHRRGYHMFNLPVVAGFSRTPTSRARFVEEELGAKVYDSIDALLDDPAVGVVDVATLHTREARLPLIEKIAKARKPVLIQKPIASTYAEAVEIVEMLEATQTVGMVNQNLSFSPGGLALPKLILEDRVVGTPYMAQMELRFYHHYPEGHPWLGHGPRWWTLAQSVHHLALLHMTFGPPRRVYALIGADSKQPGAQADTFGHLSLSYASGLKVLLASSGTYYGPNAKPYFHEELWIGGDVGVLDWNPIGAYTLSLRADQSSTDPAVRHRRVDMPGQWFPDAFGKVMRHFQDALAVGVEPLCSVQDNLYVMAVIEAAYLSGERGEVVTISEVMGNRYRADYGPGWWKGPH